MERRAVKIKAKFAIDEERLSPKQKHYAEHVALGLPYWLIEARWRVRMEEQERRTAERRERLLAKQQRAPVKKKT